MNATRVLKKFGLGLTATTATPGSNSHLQLPSKLLGLKIIEKGFKKITSPLTFTVSIMPK
jgi:hypothetical protein